MLTRLGLTAFDERCYLQLLKTPRASTDALATHVEAAHAEVTRAVTRLRRVGLVHVAEEADGLQPAPPDVAVEALVVRERRELERARLAAAELAETYQRRHVPDPDTASLVEIVHGEEAMLQRFRQMLAVVQSEMLVLDRPPVYTAPEEERSEEAELLQRVRLRAIHERRALDDPRAAARLRTLVELGEEARVTRSLPLKLAIADRKLAMISLQPEEPARPAAVLVHPCGLLDALCELFALLWEQATPIRSPADVDDPPSVLGPQDQELLGLLEMGLSDRLAARQLGLAERTVGRRVQRLMRLTGATTRFQLGHRAASRGWLDA